MPSVPTGPTPVAGWTRWRLRVRRPPRPSPACSAWGCNQRTTKGQAANRYRILDSVIDLDDGNGTLAPAHHRPLEQLAGRGSPSVLEWKSMDADAGGWYKVLNPADDWMPGENFLLESRSRRRPARAEPAARPLRWRRTSVIEAAAPVRMQVDGSAPEVRINSLAWRFEGDAAWTPLPLNCPTDPPPEPSHRAGCRIPGWSTHCVPCRSARSGRGSGNPQLVSGVRGTAVGRARRYAHVRLLPQARRRQQCVGDGGVPGARLLPAGCVLGRASPRGAGPSTPTTATCTSPTSRPTPATTRPPTTGTWASGSPSWTESVPVGQGRRRNRAPPAFAAPVSADVGQARPQAGLEPVDGRTR